MTVRLTLLAAAVAPGAAVRFGDAALPDGRALARASSLALPPATRYRTAPSPRCRATAAALGLDAEVDDALRGLGMGAWEGRTPDEVAATDPDALAAWTTDPDAAPPDGESVTALCARAAGWLAELPDGRTLAVADQAFVRAAVVHALGAAPATFWRIDAEPLSVTLLTARAGRWRLRLT
ncbi:histidine phosphatase family protein [Streptomyces sp. TRM49041]|uniref:histidine phosphatase family protein n=1 Tax=Streptomyces sp. TRM49041 TaxID=2603216 RepID=UPI0011EC4464|nr:histidine phosphatase family protein [Streptomyces sp. TRM49041]